MTTEIAKKWIDEYNFTTMLVNHLAGGLTQEESLIQLPFDVNCLNWVLGHIVTNRSHVLEVLGVEHRWKDDVRALYHTGTENITADGECFHVAVLLKYIDDSADMIRAALENVSDEYLTEWLTNYRGDKTREAHLSGFHWHETYHIGQLEIFRSLALSQRVEALVTA